MRGFYFHWGVGAWALPITLLFLAGVAFTIWMAVDAISRPAEDFSSPGAKTGWIAGIVIGFFVGIGFLVAVVYMFAVRMPARRRPHEMPGRWTPPNQGIPAPPPAYGTTAPAPSPPPPVVSPSPNCRNCGAKLLAGARFCHSCGAVV